MKCGDKILRDVRPLVLSVAFLMLIGSETRADIYTYGFQAISNNSGVSGAIAGQLMVEVSPYGDTLNQVLFKFVNEISDPYEGNIMGIFFDDRKGLGSISEFIGPAEFTVDFKKNKKDERNFPEGNNLTPPFVTTDWGVFDGGKNKIGPGEYLGVVYDLASETTTFQDVIDAIRDGISGSLRIGVHVGGIAPASEGKDSDSFITVHAPLPGAVLLAAWGFGAAGLYLRRH
jgi:hypothetical protein